LRDIVLGYLHNRTYICDGYFVPDIITSLRRTCQGGLAFSVTSWDPGNKSPLFRVTVTFQVQWLGKNYVLKFFCYSNLYKKFSRITFNLSKRLFYPQYLFSATIMINTEINSIVYTEYVFSYPLKCTNSIRTMHAFSTLLIRHWISGEVSFFMSIGYFLRLLSFKFTFTFDFSFFSSHEFRKRPP